MLINLEQKRQWISKGDPIFVIKHNDEEYIEPVIMPGKTSCACFMHNSWLDAAWYESEEEARSQIAPSVSNLYKVHKITITEEELKTTDRPDTETAQ